MRAASPGWWERTPSCRVQCARLGLPCIADRGGPSKACGAAWTDRSAPQRRYIDTGAGGRDTDHQVLQPGDRPSKAQLRKVWEEARNAAALLGGPEPPEPQVRAARAGSSSAPASTAAAAAGRAGGEGWRASLGPQSRPSASVELSSHHRTRA
jgi:hypothetical protein